MVTEYRNMIHILISTKMEIYVPICSVGSTIYLVPFKTAMHPQWLSTVVPVVSISVLNSDRNLDKVDLCHAGANTYSPSPCQMSYQFDSHSIEFFTNS